ncbi:uncharacterized protein LOC141680100 [Apium graveolens]|uniref:uncharacterized protein LOC141680100 n=1 Tax=Apium graveolens TaxID=4045 RepID=UPI003D7BAC3C
MFKKQIGKTMEVYVDDMLVKSKRAEDHIADLAKMFHILRQYKMKLNPQKCVFGVESGKFLGFMVNHRGIEANPAKIKALQDMKSPTSVKQVQSLTGRIAALNRFVSKSSDRCKEFFKRGVGNGRSKPPVARIICEQKVVGCGNQGQALADFILEFDAEVDDKAIVLAEPTSQGNSHDEKRQELPHPWWLLHVDGAVNNNGSGAGIILVTLEGHRLMSAIHFKFYATNNDVEYEALINGLKLTLEVGAMNLIVWSDSELVVNQVNGGFQARGPRTELYMRCAQRLLNFFLSTRLESVPREEYSNTDALAKMGSQMDSVQLGQIPLGIQEIPSIPEVEVFQMQEVPRESWMTPIPNYIQTGAVPEDKL